MKISRHIRYIEDTDYCLREEMLFDPPVDFVSTLGSVDPDIYKGVDFTAEGNSITGETAASVVNDAMILDVREVMKSGEVLSVEIKIGHRLKNITVAPEHQRQLLVWRGLNGVSDGLLYWFTVGKDGVLEITAEVIPDDDGFLDKLKVNLTDTAMRAYLMQKSLADSVVTLEQIERVPDVMTTEEAARYLGISTSKLYKMAQSGEIPRTRHRKYIKKDLDAFKKTSYRRGK